MGPDSGKKGTPGAITFNPSSTAAQVSIGRVYPGYEVNGTQAAPSMCTHSNSTLTVALPFFAIY
jgi:hypothetical protein